jgi:hypothetical protein
MAADAKAVEGVVARGEAAFRVVRTLRVSLRGVSPTVFVMKRI